MRVRGRGTRASWSRPPFDPRRHSGAARPHPTFGSSTERRCGAMDTSSLTACNFDCYGTLIDWEGGLGAFLYEKAVRARDPDAVNVPGLRECWEQRQFWVNQ